MLYNLFCTQCTCSAKLCIPAAICHLVAHLHLEKHICGPRQIMYLQYLNRVRLRL